MTPLPMTVISGYLGAGKTTLINRLLAQDHGLKLLILVNDFGAINIDENLLAARDDDTIALTNGCVCCTMGADLVMALGDALDRRPRPDHLIVEASGVADPAQIANCALAEPEMRYAGVVTVVDGPVFAELSADPMIGPQISQQVARADLVWISKDRSVSPQLSARINALTDAPIFADDNILDLVTLLLSDMTPVARHPVPMAHPRYASWSYQGDAQIPLMALRGMLSARPVGLFRVKGFVRDPGGAAWEVQCVGHQVSLAPTTGRDKTALVGIGLEQRLNRREIEAWWATCLSEAGTTTQV